MSEEEKNAIEAIKQEIDRYKAIEMPKGVYITDIKMLLSIVEKQQKKIKDLEDENYFLKEMYRGTTEYKAIKKKVEELGWN